MALQSISGAKEIPNIAHGLKRCFCKLLTLLPDSLNAALSRPNCCAARDCALHHPPKRDVILRTLGPVVAGQNRLGLFKCLRFDEKRLHTGTRLPLVSELSTPTDLSIERPGVKNRCTDVDRHKRNLLRDQFVEQVRLSAKCHYGNALDPAQCKPFDDTSCPFVVIVGRTDHNFKVVFTRNVFKALNQLRE
jgi:hypothetical protein